MKWCSYCQRFIGETAAYDDLGITHGVCKECAPKALDFDKSDFEHAYRLRDIQKQLFQAGQRSDLAAAERIIADAASANIRPVDILMGIIAPMLYQVGEDWKRNILRMEEERRFTAFCEKIFDLVAAKVGASVPVSVTQAGNAEVLLMNAPGNTHTLAIRILALWLLSKGMQAQIVDTPPGPEEFIALVKRVKPRILLISMALAEQCESVMSFVERIAELPSATRPKVIVGGYAIKFGLVSAVAGADIMADISSL